MIMTSSQKNYIRKNVKKRSIDEICQYLKIDRKDLLQFLEDRWGKDRLESFLSGTKSTLQQNTKNLRLLGWIQANYPFLLLLIGLIFLTYVNSINNNFLSDDIAEIKNNPQIQTLELTLSRPLGFVRPLLYWLMYHLAELTPSAFRLINYFFHIGSTVVLFAIIQMLYNRPAAVIAASLFAVHPALVEPIVWISGGAYVQYTFFYLLSILFYLLYQRYKTLKLYYLSLVSFFLSLESQQIAITLPLVLSVYEFSLGKLKRRWMQILPFLLMASIWIAFSLATIPERVHTLQTVHYQQKTTQNLFTVIPIAVSSYLELLVFPKDLTLYHSELNFGFFNFAIRSTAILLLFITAIYSFFKDRNYFFWLLFFIINLVPTIITATFGLTWIVAERYLYLASVGIFVSVALFAKYLLERNVNRQVVFGVIIVLLGISITRSIIRNIDWASEDNLWVATGKTSPSSPNTHNNLGDVYGRHGDKQAALREFQTAILLKPNYADAYHNLANTYHELQDEPKALENYQKAVEINPNLWQSYQNIAAIYYQQGKFDLALENINNALKINPKNPHLNLNLGIIYLVKGDKLQAKQAFMQVLILDPKNEQANAALLQLSGS